MASRFRTILDEEEEKENKPGRPIEVQPGQQTVDIKSEAQNRIESLLAVNPKMSRFRAIALADQAVVEETMSAWGMVKEAITGAKRTTEETKNLPEVLSVGGLNIDGNLGKNLKVATGLLLAADDTSQMNIIKEYAPEVQFNQDEQGNVFGDYKGQKFILNKPGFSFADAQRAIVDMAAFLPAAKFTAIGRGLLSKAGLAAASNAATEYGLRQAREGLGSQEKSGMEAEAAGIAAMMEIPVPVAGAILRRAKPFAERAVTKFGFKELGKKIANAGVTIDESALKNLEEAENISRMVGIDFLPTQATGRPADDILQRVLTEMPSSTKSIMDYIWKQDAQTKRAVNKFLTRIAPSSSLVEGPAKFKKAAGKAISDLVEHRKSETESLYRNLFQDPPDVDVNKVIDTINSNLEKFREGGRVHSALVKARKLIGGTPKKTELYISPNRRQVATTYAAQSLDVLHNAKLEIDDLISGVGEKAVSSTAKRELTKVKELLLNVMEDPAMGGSPVYKEVRNKFAELSEPINQLRESLIGRASQLNDVDLRRMTNIIFNPSESNPQTVSLVKQIVDKADPEAFPMLMRAFLEERVENISKRAKNAPNEFSVALFKNAKQRKMLYSVMDKNTKQNAMWLERALEISARGRSSGSDTASKTELIKKMSGNALSPLVSIIAPSYMLGSVGAALSGARMISSALTKSTLDRRVKVLADVLTNERWTKDMAKIIKLDPRTPNAMRQLAQVLNNAESELADKEKDDQLSDPK